MRGAKTRFVLPIPPLQTGTSQKAAHMNKETRTDVRDGGFGKAGVTQRGQGTPEGPTAWCCSSASEREVCSTLRLCPAAGLEETGDKAEPPKPDPRLTPFPKPALTLPF